MIFFMVMAYVTRLLASFSLTVLGWPLGSKPVIHISFLSYLNLISYSYWRTHKQKLPRDLPEKSRQAWRANPIPQEPEMHHGIWLVGWISVTSAIAFDQSRILILEQAEEAYRHIWVFQISSHLEILWIFLFFVACHRKVI